MKESNQHIVGKGYAKADKSEILPTRDTITGKRRVKVNDNTWVYTSCKTDEQAIDKFNKLHQMKQ